MAKEPIAVEIVLSEADIKKLIIDFLINEGFLRDNSCALRWTYNWENDGEFTGVSIMDYVVRNDSPRAIDNGDGTASFKGKLVGMGF